MGPAEPLDCRDDTETLLRTMPLYLLPVDPDRPIPLEPLEPGVRTCGVGGPLSTSCTVLESAAVPCMPMRK